jgi:hypothetical protein
MYTKEKFLTRKSSGGHQARKRKKGRKNLSPRNRKACPVCMYTRNN